MTIHKPSRLERYFPTQTIVVRTIKGERRLHFSPIARLALSSCAIAFAAYAVGVTGVLAFNSFNLNSETKRQAALGINYEERIDALAKERDSLREKLSQSQDNLNLVIARIGTQQDLLFDSERENIELSKNLDTIRQRLLVSQSNLNALNLQVDTQKTQIAALSSGQSLVESDTLATMTSTLTETAIARDEARAEVQALKNELDDLENRQLAEARHRDEMINQIEEAVDVSLTPMENVLRNTGLNVDSLLSTIKRNYSGTGGIGIKEDVSIVADSPQQEVRIENLFTDLERISLMSTALQQLPIGNPVRASYRLTSPYGYRRHPITRRKTMHDGMDMAAPIGTDIFSTADGRVIFAGWSSGYGKTIKIQHEFGIETRYAHLSNIRVNAGDYVKAGQHIGDMGSTGRSTGSHLHYEVRVNGVTTNPSTYIRAAENVR